MKKIFLLSFIVLSGCNSGFFGNKPDSLSEKLSLMDYEMKQQSGKIEVLEHENRKIKEELELIKSDFQARFETIESKEPAFSQQDENLSQESDEPTELNSL